MKVSSLNNHHWLEITETITVVCSIGGSIMGLFLKQFIWATVPLSASAAFALLNQRRLKNIIIEEQKAIASIISNYEAKVNELKVESAQNRQTNKAAVVDLEEELGQVRNLAITELTRLQQASKADFDATGQELEKLQATVTKLSNLSQKLEQNLNTVDDKQKETGKMVRELKAIDIFTQNIKAEVNTVQSYYERGLTYQRLGNKHRAINDYSSTLELDNNHAQAYHHRGVLYSELGIEQKALIDLRRASQLYFDKGNLDKYRETRDLSQKIYQNQSLEPAATSEQDTESVVVANLFG